MGAPLLGTAKRTLDGGDRSQMMWRGASWPGSSRAACPIHWSACPPVENLELGILHPVEQHVHACQVVGSDVLFLSVDLAYALRPQEAW
jgi:hypothetical protein